jgi:hypothetical protein
MLDIVLCLEYMSYKRRFGSWLYCRPEMAGFIQVKNIRKLWDGDYRMQWNKVEIIPKEENTIIRKLKASVSIITEQAFSQPSLGLSFITLPLLRDRRT